MSWPRGFAPFLFAIATLLCLAGVGNGVGSDTVERAPSGTLDTAAASSRAGTDDCHAGTTGTHRSGTAIIAAAPGTSALPDVPGAVGVIRFALNGQDGGHATAALSSTPHAPTHLNTFNLLI